MIEYHSNTRREIIVYPDWSRGYNLSKPLDEVLQENAESTENLALEMDGEFFKGQLRNGFFIEAGASNGELFKGMNKKKQPQNFSKVTQTLTVCIWRPGITGRGCWWSPWESSPPRTGRPPWSPTVWLSKRGLTTWSSR